MAKSSRNVPPIPFVSDFNSIASLNWEGKVFSTGNVVQGTEITGQTGLALTLATVYLANTSAKAMMMLWARFFQGGTVAGGQIEWQMQALRVGKFTSGTALAVVCANQEKQTSSEVTANHTATIPALGTNNAFQVGSGSIFHAVATTNSQNPLEMVTPGQIIINPGGGLLIYTFAASTGPSWSFNIGWAELEV